MYNLSGYLIFRVNIILSLWIEYFRLYALNMNILLLVICSYMYVFMNNARQYFSSEGNVIIDGKQLQNVSLCLAPTIPELIFKSLTFCGKSHGFWGSIPKVRPKNDVPQPFHVLPLILLPVNPVLGMFNWNGIQI